MTKKLTDLIVLIEDEDGTWSIPTGPHAGHHYGTPYAAVAAYRGETNPNMEFARQAGRREGVKLASNQELLKELSKRVSK